MLSTAIPLLVLTLALGPLNVSSYSRGAHPSVCGTMVPGHNGTKPQETPTPFKIVLGSTTPTSEQPVSITLTSRSGTDPFIGFLIQVREVEGEESVGEFQVPGNGDAQTLDCFDKSNSAVTHTSKKIKDSVTVQWIPPSGGDYQVYYTAVGQNGGVFWSKVRSPEIMQVSGDEDDEDDS